MTLLMLGLTFLEGNKFSPETVMPICLPTSKRFNDTRRLVTSVGVGLKRFKARTCFTDGNGPEVFQPCAPLWVGPGRMEKNVYGRYTQWRHKCTKEAPPSSANEICKDFHDKIQILK